MKIQNPYFRNWLLDPVSKIIIRLPLKLKVVHFVKDKCIQKVGHSKLYVPGRCTLFFHINILQLILIGFRILELGEPLFKIVEDLLTNIENPFWRFLQ